MRPSSRRPVNKSSSSREFRNKGRTTKAANVAPPPMRGGFRL